MALYFQKEPSCKKICDDLYRRFGVGRICVCGQQESQINVNIFCFSLFRPTG